MYLRKLALSDAKKSFLLWGQRQTGKSSLLRSTFPDALVLNLLHADVFLELSSKPSRLREYVKPLARGQWVILDEVQKVPLLLDEVHDLIETQGLRFGLCGSSARKLKRAQANLLGGRARRFELLGFSASELGEDFELTKMLNRGYLPPHYIDDEYFFGLQSYLGDYLKEEIAAEGLVRNLPSFSRFLESAAIGDAEVINFSSLGRDVGVSPKTAQAYYEILVDTLTAVFVPAYTKRAKRRTQQSPKFYFHDVGIVNYLCRRRQLEPPNPLFGKAFENWVHHELAAFIRYAGSDCPLFYWHLSTGVEVDFVLGDMELAIEAKATDRVRSDHLKSLRELKNDFRSIRQRVVVCLESRIRKTEDGILILPYQDFVSRLWSNALHHDVTLEFE